LKEAAERALDVAHGLGASYADARVIEQATESIRTKNEEVSAVDIGASMGIGIRVLADGGWGFSSTQDLSDAGIEKAAREALLVARASAQCMDKPIELAKELTYTAEWSSPCQKDPFAVDLDTKIAVLLKAAKSILAVPGVTLAKGGLHFIRDKKYFASTEGSRIYQTFHRAGCGIEADATGNNDRQRRSYPDADGQWELAGWEMVEKWNLPAHAQRVGEEAVALLNAPSCPQTTSDIILGGSQLALQLHESCGHPCELDRALGQEVNLAGASFMTPDKLNKLQYGSKIVNIVADATAAGALGSFGFDDEGVQAQRNFLIKDGLFCGYLSSRDTAALIGLKRSGGNMRASSWKVVPIIRMTNVSLIPGNAGKLDDLIADTKDGILLDTNRSWSIDQMRYNFQFSTECAWEIKNGKRGRMLKNASYGGITTEFWNSCDAICGDTDYVDWGTPSCGKGQPMQSMWTGHGASPARFRNIKVGIAHNI
jgi:TldD protein